MVLALTLALVGSAITAPASDPPIKLWLNSDATYVSGDHGRVHIRADHDGYALVLRADADGHVRVLFPIDPGSDNFVRGGDKREIRGRGDRDAFEVDERSGTGMVFVAWSGSPFKFDQFVRGDHWDYRALDNIAANDDKETALLDAVQTMAEGNHFEYDELTYSVTTYTAYYHRPYYGPYVGPCFGCGVYPTWGTWGGWGGWGWGRPHWRLGVTIGVGYPYSPYYYSGWGWPRYYRPYAYWPGYRPFVYRSTYFGARPYAPAYGGGLLVDRVRSAPVSMVGVRTRFDDRGSNRGFTYNRPAPRTDARPMVTERRRESSAPAARGSRGGGGGSRDFGGSARRGGSFGGGGGRSWGGGRSGGRSGGGESHGGGGGGRRSAGGGGGGGGRRR